MCIVFRCWIYLILSHPIPSHLSSSHLILSYLILINLIVSYLTLSTRSGATPLSRSSIPSLHVLVVSSLWPVTIPSITIVCEMPSWCQSSTVPPASTLASSSSLSWGLWPHRRGLVWRRSLQAVSWLNHYNDVIISAMASQITSVSIVCSTVGSGRSKKTSKLRVTGLYAGNSPVTGEFPAQRASNATIFSIWWRHHV